ncbi:hypothetical protein SHKM778_84580 [Streptomyces sp. KM77-8]|uniref:DUF4864 domain-containing protein n=1 Tax=Streptomyces haneummycinicus TaxID=3074435 RepID=A0AAT9HX93_9ACTN
MPTTPTGTAAPRTDPERATSAAAAGRVHHLAPTAGAPHRPAGGPVRGSSPGAGVPPRLPAGRVASAPSPGGRRPVAAARATRPADNRPAPRAGRRTTTPAPGVQGASTAGGRPRAGDRAPVRPAVPQPQPTDRFAELLLAVLSGQRPVHAMLRHTAGRAYDDLVRLAERVPLRTRGVRPVVRDIGWFEPREGAIEVFARIGAGTRLRAMAFRLEQGRDLRWRCTAVELGGSRTGIR